MFRKLKQFFIKNNPTKINSERAILIIDDNPVDRRLIERILQNKGYRVFTASNGYDGLKLAKSTQLHLILLDYELTDLAGAQVCKELKNDERTKNIPVIFLTGADTAKSIFECFDLDVENYFAKPIAPSFLTSQVEMVLKEYV